MHLYFRSIIITITIILFIVLQGIAQNKKILFDASKAQMAGNADWIIDADAFNLGSNNSGDMVIGRSDDANPQRFPTPAQSGITQTTGEEFWTGGLSNWAIDMVKQGFQVETLPYNGAITYGNSSNVQDLSNYKVFVVDEPNIPFSATEKDAMVNFVYNGGGLFIIADHDISDRNGDGFDSPHIWNDMFTTNNILQNPFGISFDYQDYSQTTSNIANLPNDSCLHGILGNATQMKISGGTTMTINPTKNSTVIGLVYKSGSSNTGNTNVFFARANYGSGKVCALGDSSPPDDGTGDVNDILYNGYTAEASGSHRKLIVNSTLWLAARQNSNAQIEENIDNKYFKLYPNPSHGIFTIEFAKSISYNVSYEIFDIYGRIVFEKNNEKIINGTNSLEIEFPLKGVFIIKLYSNGYNYSEILIAK